MGSSIVPWSEESRRYFKALLTQIPCIGLFILVSLGQGTKKRQPISTAAIDVCRLFLFPNYASDVLFRFMPRGHHFMATTQAFESEVRAGAQNFPPLFAAGVGLLHDQNIMQLNVHILPLLFDGIPILLC